MLRKRLTGEEFENRTELTALIQGERWIPELQGRFMGFFRRFARAGFRPDAIPGRSGRLPA